MKSENKTKNKLATINQQVPVEVKNKLRDYCRINNISASTFYSYILTVVKQKDLDKLKKRY